MRWTIAFLALGILVCLQNCFAADTAHAGVAERAIGLLCPGRPLNALLIAREARRQLLPSGLLVAVIAHESGCRSDAKSGRGDFGLGQIRVGGSAARGATVAELMDPEINIRLTAAHLARVLTLCGGLSGLSVYSGHKRCRSSRYSRAVLGLFWSTFAVKRERNG